MTTNTITDTTKKIILRGILTDLREGKKNQDYMNFKITSDSGEYLLISVLCVASVKLLAYISEGDYVLISTDEVKCEPVVSQNGKTYNNYSCFVRTIAKKCTDSFAHFCNENHKEDMISDEAPF